MAQANTGTQVGNDVAGGGGDANPGFAKRVIGDLSRFFVPKDTPLRDANPSKAGNTPAAPPQGNVTQQPPQPKMNADGTPVLDGNGKLVMQESSNSPAGAKTPMDAYAKLFEPITIDDKAPKAPTFNLTPEVISKAAGGMDFTADLPPELSEALQGGTLDAKTMLALVNHVGRQSYTRAMEHASTLTNKFVDMRGSYERTQELPKAVQKILAASQVSALPNVKDNPVVKAHMEFIAGQFSERYPDMTPNEVTEATTKYFQDMAMALNPSLEQGNKGGRQRPHGHGGSSGDDLEFDFEAYLK